MSEFAKIKGSITVRPDGFGVLSQGVSPKDLASLGGISSIEDSGVRTFGELLYNMDQCGVPEWAAQVCTALLAAGMTPEEINEEPVKCSIDENGDYVITGKKIQLTQERSSWL